MQSKRKLERIEQRENAITDAALKQLSNAELEVIAFHRAEGLEKTPAFRRYIKLRREAAKNYERTKKQS